MNKQLTVLELDIIAKNILNTLNLDHQLSVKERLAIPVQEMPTQDLIVRRENTNEVALGYTEDQARAEALRCLQCKNAPCVNGCPVRIDIPRFIKEIAKGNFQKAIEVIKENSLLPAVCGRVCPQEVQCQLNCTVGKFLKDVSKSVAIGRLERFVADMERKSGNIKIPQIKPDTSKKVAVVGSGPASIVVAADVRKEGHNVALFEAFHKTGGVMTYGIPEFRLPKAIVKSEIDILNAMGVDIRTNFVVGKTRKLTDLIEKDGYDAVFIGTGAGLPKFMNIKGENLVGVYSANEFLTRANLMRAYEREIAATPIAISERVAVVGGGNVAMDAARTAVRLGAKEVYIIYRRTEKEMPARVEEIAHAKEEGVIFHILVNPKRILGKTKAEAIECLKYQLGDTDDSGRRRPVEIPNSEFVMDIDTVIIAIGNESNPLISQTTSNLKCNKWGNIIVDENCKTSMNKVYAGGDIVLGAATVILAMGQGRTAASSINKLLAEN